MYKVYKITKTSLVDTKGNKETEAEFWTHEEAVKAAKDMPLRNNEHVEVELRTTFDERFTTDYLD